MDATYCKARVNSRVVSRAVVIATVPREREVPPVTADGRREVLGVVPRAREVPPVGDSEDETFWTAFLRTLKKRGLAGVQLVISDAHEGLKKAITTTMAGASWQRCRVHFARNLLAAVPKTQAEVVVAAYRTIFANPDATTVAAAWNQVAATLRHAHPKVAALMDTAREDVLAFTSFPTAHWKKIWSTNPLERLNKEVKRRTVPREREVPPVVGVFPHDKALLRLVTAVLIEAHDEWAASDRRYLSEASMAALTGKNITELPAAAPHRATAIDTGAAITA